ncbi:hypothetical protein [Scytonema sp. NUACC26]|uniref:hypothetical protein n=1 Tax=Scytonema sp. NUACC26 TaxID=3140176 RepID=UPI0034DC6B30
MVHKESNQEQPILPRYPWKDRTARFKLTIVKTKKALDEAEKKVWQRADLD